MAIGRIERALSRLEQISAMPAASESDPELFARHARLKAETRLAITDIDKLLAGSRI